MNTKTITMRAVEPSLAAILHYTVGLRLTHIYPYCVHVHKQSLSMAVQTFIPGGPTRPGNPFLPDVPFSPGVPGSPGAPCRERTTGTETTARAAAACSTCQVHSCLTLQAIKTGGGRGLGWTVAHSNKNPTTWSTDSSIYHYINPHHCQTLLAVLPVPLAR